MYLYKYYKNYNYFKEVIEKNTLYFGDVKEYNDPYEEAAVVKDKNSGKYFGVLDIKNNSKIYCFSTSCKNYLLWSHYADGHKGFCIEFDFNNVNIDNNKYLQTNIIDQNIIFARVQYGGKIKETYLSNFRNGIWGEDYIDFFINKYNCWEYEDEVRAIIMSKKSKKVKIPKSYIKRVIIGLKSNKLKEIDSLLKLNGYKIKVEKTYIKYNSETLFVLSK